MKLINRRNFLTGLSLGTATFALNSVAQQAQPACLQTNQDFSLVTASPLTLAKIKRAKNLL